MASELLARLLRLIKVDTTMAAKKGKAKLEENSRCWLYSSDAPEGRIFKGADAIAAAKKDGWKDSPAKVKSAGGKGKDKDARK